MRVRTHLRKLYSDTAPIEYIFDQGDEGKGKLMAAMDKWGLPPPIFRHSKPVKGKPEIIPTVQLQCCDFAAWELRKANIAQDDPGLMRYRKSLEALRSSNTTWKEYVQLEEFCADNEVVMRIGETTDKQ